MTHPCIQCGRILEEDGEMVFEGKTFHVFHCEHCLRKWQLVGKDVGTTLRFGVADDGTIIDPDSPDTPLTLN